MLISEARNGLFDIEFTSSVRFQSLFLELLQAWKLFFSPTPCNSETRAFLLFLPTLFYFLLFPRNPCAKLYSHIDRHGRIVTDRQDRA